MQDVLDHLDVEVSDISEDTLLSRIWLQPKETLTYILQNCPRKHVNLFLFAGGTVGAIGNMVDEGLVDWSSILFIFLGGALGLLLSYLVAWLINVTGYWVGGEADSPPLRTVLAWSQIPLLWSLALLVPKFVFSQAGADKPLVQVLWTASDLISLGLVIWSVVILFIGVRLVQGFGFWRTLANLLLSFLMSVLIGFLASVLILPFLMMLG